MRFFEIILIIIAVVLPFYISLKKDIFNNKYPLIFIIGVFIIHLVIEGYRWQMLPVYFIMTILIWYVFKGYRFFRGHWFRKTFSIVVLLLCLVIGGLLSYMLPVLKLPKPTGYYSVGSQYIHFKTNQDEIITSEAGDKRQLMIKVWYPSNVKNELTEPYLNDGDRKGFATKYGLPVSIFNYLDYVETNTYDSPEVAEGKYPVLIFSHGLYSKASGYYALLEEIVSHGYIVLNINHTYESTGTLFPNGDIELFHTEFDLKNNNQEMGEMVWEATENYKKAKSWNEEHDAIKNAIKNYVGAEITNRWAKDFALVNNKLESWNTSTFLANHMDLSKLGVFGHSQGASAAGQALLDNKNIKAGISIDGMQWGKMIDTKMTKPFALLVSDWPDSHPNWNKHAFHNGSTSDFYNAKILNSGHSSFMDIPLMIKLKLINEAGTINPSKAHKITADMVIQFFDAYLLDKPNTLLEMKNKYHDLEIELHK